MRGIALALSLGLLAAACQDEPRPQGSPPAPASPLPTEAPPVGADPAGFRGRLVQVATLQQPLAMAVRLNDPALYFAEKGGLVVAVRDGAVDPQPVLDLSRRVSQGSEQGLLGIAFSSNGGFLYANWTDLAGDTHVSEFPMRADGTAGREAGRDVLVHEQPYTNHNGGHLAFGPDGFLYIGLGDGGSAGDPQENAQNLGSLLGKILRIDPRPSGGEPYSIPGGNPFVGEPGGRPEVWSYGLRNPWRFSFDRVSGDLWIADVGQGAREEINVERAAQGGGVNFGWDGYEGTLEFEQPLPEDPEMPVYEYGRDLGTTVIGGHVYRGEAIPALQGAYIFGDHTNPELRALVLSGSEARHVPLGLTVPSLSAFGEDGAGELYALSLAGPVYRLSP